MLCCFRLISHDSVARWVCVCVDLSCLICSCVVIVCGLGCLFGCLCVWLVGSLLNNAQRTTCIIFQVVHFMERICVLPEAPHPSSFPIFIAPSRVDISCVVSCMATYRVHYAQILLEHICLRFVHWVAVLLLSNVCLVVTSLMLQCRSFRLAYRHIHASPYAARQCSCPTDVDTVVSVLSCDLTR